MTREEKAKAYDEALERARKLNNGKDVDVGAGTTTCEYIFPELQESEDERIRKFICSIIDNLEPKDFVGVKKMNVIAWLEKQKEQKPILEVFGFKIGDAVRLKDGDGRKHIIKSFKEVEGIHGPNFYQVEFEDNSARDGIYPGEEYPNGYYTQMEKFEGEPVDLEKEIDKTVSECTSGYNFDWDRFARHFYELGRNGGSK